MVIERKTLILNIFAESPQRVRKFWAIPKRPNLGIREKLVCFVLEIDRYPSPIRVVNRVLSRLV